MLTQIQGLHHVTSMARSARANNAFFTGTLGLRRVKKTVNFDAPDVYHLYYGNTTGAPGSVLTYFPFPNAARGRHGAGEVATTSFSIPPGSGGRWYERLAEQGVAAARTEVLGETHLCFDGPDGEKLSLVETPDNRLAWTDGGISAEMAIRGFTGVTLQLRDIGASRELLSFMGYQVAQSDGPVTRMTLPHGRAASTIDLVHTPEAPAATQGAGSVHHIAFAVENRSRQLEVREALADAGWAVTPVIDRDYFHAIYFRTPGGVLFEIATNEPGFATDEDAAHLGEALMLPRQHAHLRSQLEKSLEPLEA